jgi:hypothetical protein
MTYRKISPYKLPERHLSHEEAVQDILDDLTAGPRPAWTYIDAATVAQGLERAARQGVIAPVVEAMWRYFECVNEP